MMLILRENCKRKILREAKGGKREMIASHN